MRLFTGILNDAVNGRLETIILIAFLSILSACTKIETRELAELGTESIIRQGMYHCNIDGSEDDFYSMRVHNSNGDDSQFIFSNFKNLGTEVLAIHSEIDGLSFPRSDLGFINNQRLILLRGNISKYSADKIVLRFWIQIDQEEVEEVIFGRYFSECR